MLLEEYSIFGLYSFNNYCLAELVFSAPRLIFALTWAVGSIYSCFEIPVLIFICCHPV